MTIVALTVASTVDCHNNNNNGSRSGIVDRSGSVDSWVYRSVITDNDRTDNFCIHFKGWRRRSCTYDFSLRGVGIVPMTFVYISQLAVSVSYR